MTMTIGVCDDCREQVELLLQYLNHYCEHDGFQIIHSTKPQDFLNELEAVGPQLIFLDIDMGEINGIKLGGKIKSLFPEVVIVYITAYEKYALEAFGVRAFHYLLKPLTKEKFDQAMDEALEYIRNKSSSAPEKSFSIQVKGEFVCIPFSDIFCFEKVGHRIKIHTTDREIYYYDNLQNLVGQLDSSIFLQCHQGYIVNLDKIRSFREKTLFLERNLELPVSRSYAEAVRDRLARRLFAGKETK